MKRERDVYIISVPRGARVQLGPTEGAMRGRPASTWRTLSRREVAALIKNRVNVGCIDGAKVWIEPRARYFRDRSRR